MPSLRTEEPAIFWGTLLFIGIGLLCLTAAIHMTVGAFQFRAEAAIAEGRIHANETRAYAFTLPDGRRIEGRVNHICLRQCVRGREVRVRYLPGQPGVSEIVGEPGNWVFVAVAGLFGLAGTLLGGGALRAFSREFRRGEERGAAPAPRTIPTAPPAARPRARREPVLFGLGLVFALGALLTLAVALSAIWEEVSFRRVAVRTEARVVRMTEHTARDDRQYWFPTFVFILPDGREQQRVGPGKRQRDQTLGVGDTVTVRYDPAAPERAVIIGGFFDSWGKVFAFSLFTAFLGVVGAVAIAMSRLEQDDTAKTALAPHQPSRNVAMEGGGDAAEGDES